MTPSLAIMTARLRAAVVRAVRRSPRVAGLRRSWWAGFDRQLVAIVVTTAALAALAQGQGYIEGVFVGTPNGPVELMVYAEQIRNGQMRLSGGGVFEDVPEVDTVQQVLCSLPNWKPVSVWVASSKIFRDEYAERRTLAIAGRALNVATLVIRVRDLEDRKNVERLIRSVRATGDEVPYAFVHLTSGGVERHYMVRLRTER
jgi:hypothetical protein